ncbi:MAG: ketoacyl-ACP synthase III [Planctomycetes bacterium]|nr:ketoacyl-ACP synthase III [Planctomycetota bacterium]MBL7008772.1 ketoacyl-ACP synthase III [Planctomycetota bacterium]
MGHSEFPDSPLTATSQSYVPRTSTRIRGTNGKPEADAFPQDDASNGQERRAGTSVLGMGSALPPNVVSNAEVAERTGLTEDWIVQRTGIQERRHSAPGVRPSLLGAESAVKAMEQAGVKPEELGFILCTTLTPDTPVPATACWIQAEIGANRVPAIDLNAACSGFLYGWKIADALMRSDASMGPILLVAVEQMSRIVDPTDPHTCAIFGDGAASVVIGRAEAGFGLLGCTLGADGAGASLIQVPAGGGHLPASHETVDAGLHYLQMQGREIFKLAVNEMTGECEALLNELGIDADEIKLVVPHQANARILDSVARHLGVADRIHVNIAKVGNTVSASIPLALEECATQGKLKRGDLVLLTAFGAGLTWGAAVVRW